MRSLFFVMLWCEILSEVPMAAMGFTEDPQEKLTKTFSLAPFHSLEIRGEVEFELIVGPKPLVTVETSRALFDQLTVSNWWGAATLAIESGLRGPREQGTVKMTIALPSLEELTVSDHCSGRGMWPGKEGTIRILDNSTVDMDLEGTDFTVDTSWKTQVILKGHTTKLRTTLRHQSFVDTQKLTVEEASIALDENSTFESGPVDRGSGTVRHQSRVSLEKAEGWEELVLKEDSVKEIRGAAAQ